MVDILKVNLRRLLDERSWTPNHLVARLSDLGRPVHVKTVERWLEGLNAPRCEQLAWLARAFEVDMSELVSMPVNTAAGDEKIG